MRSWIAQHCCAINDRTLTDSARSLTLLREGLLFEPLLAIFAPIDRDIFHEEILPTTLQVQVQVRAFTRARTVQNKPPRGAECKHTV